MNVIMRRLILGLFYQLQETNDVAVVAKDTDVLVLLVWAYAHHDIKQNWFFKYDAQKYANICKICDYSGKDQWLVIGHG